MTKTFKKIAASVMAVATLAVGAAGMTASATDQSFWFNILDKGDYSWSSENPKDDAEQKAYIHTLGGSVSSTAPLYFTLYKVNDKVSNRTPITSITGYNNSYKINYTTWVGSGSPISIYATSGYRGSSANGFWYS